MTPAVPLLEAPSLPSLRRVAAEARTSVGATRIVRDLAVEVPVAFVYNGEPYTVMMASPGDLGDFALGFSLAEGILRRPVELEALEIVEQPRGLELRLSIPARRARFLAARPRNMAGRRGCGLCGVASLEQVLRPLPVTAAVRALLAPRAVSKVVTALPEAQTLNRQVRAVHAAAWCNDEGRLLLLREDVGRHNALDKLVGAQALAGLGEAEGFVIITSRLSVEMVQKAATVGIAVVVAISAPTTLAIEQAEACGVTLVALARENGFQAYTHIYRIDGTTR